MVVLNAVKINNHSDLFGFDAPRCVKVLMGKPMVVEKISIIHGKDGNPSLPCIYSISLLLPFSNPSLIKFGMAKTIFNGHNKNNYR
jgi:hypothetical protein